MLKFLPIILSRVYNIEREGEYLTLHYPSKTHRVKLLHHLLDVLVYIILVNFSNLVTKGFLIGVK